ncbi:MAG: extracellular solute-binding protein [Anaeromicrobium sp.]|jgi:inositol-phosphate transport system substrate-binding protein|uniref:ABC transporter substrate-binding protein n=1 Tax=Anaeromicrobium sp. TaxID=1929132 RepID=UPI0025EFFF68|nr:extracellular solute-binding protein [Anaeromicrobium sp.]MCT4595444.1 extracellular solute-binding protein [Anaeromicrobium sp.]
MDRKVIKLGIIFIIILLIITVPRGTGSSSENTIKIKAFTFGAENTRIDNLVKASEQLNKKFKAKGQDKRIFVESENHIGSWEKYKKEFIDRYNKDQEPDIYITGHENIAWLAKDGYIYNLNELKEASEYKDVFTTLWKSVKWQDNIWAAIQDVDVELIFYNKDKLRKLGWSNEEIHDLPERVLRGEFILEDMTNLAKRAINEKICTWGILHRPTNGQFFYMMAKNFDSYSIEDKQVIFNENNLKKSLEYFYDNAQNKKITPMDNSYKSWNEIYDMVLNDEVLFWYGGSYGMFDLINDGGASYDEIMDKFGVMLIPSTKKGEKPITISHPIVYTISNKSKYKNEIIQLLKEVSKPKYQVNHDIKTYHLPINKRSAKDKSIKNNEFLNSILYMLDYTTFLPNNNKYYDYSHIYFKCVQKVEQGEYTPKEALKHIKIELNKQ